MIGNWLGNFVGWWFGTNEETPPTPEVGYLCKPSIKVVRTYFKIVQVPELSTNVVYEVLTTKVKDCPNS